MLSAAAGPVPFDTLLDIAASRFGAAVTPILVDLDTVPAPSDVDSFAEPSEAAEDVEQAKMVWEQLSHRERLLMKYVDEPVRLVADLTGLSKSTVANVFGRIRAILRQALASDASTGVVTLLMGLVHKRLDSTLTKAVCEDGEGIRQERRQQA